MEYINVRILKPHWMFPYPLGSVVRLEEEDATMLINDGCAELGSPEIIPESPDPRNQEKTIGIPIEKEKWWKRLFAYLREQRARFSRWLITKLQKYADEL